MMSPLFHSGTTGRKYNFGAGAKGGSDQWRVTSGEIDGRRALREKP